MRAVCPLDTEFDALPFPFQDRLRQARDALDVPLGLGFVQLLRLDTLECRIDRSAKLLMIGFRGIDKQSGFPLYKHNAFELCQPFRLRGERAAASVPFVLPFRLDHRPGDKERDQLGKKIPQCLDPPLPIGGDDVRAELAPCDRKRDPWPDYGCNEGGARGDQAYQYRIHGLVRRRAIDRGRLSSTLCR